MEEKRLVLFEHIVSLEESPWLKESLELAWQLPIKSEKARSELIVTPILLELKKRNSDFLTFYSGDTLIGDKENGLIGECDFIIARNTNSFSIEAPLLAVVEAKRNDVESGIAQCAAQMLGVQCFNEKHFHPLPIVFGCVTTGEIWLFLKLENQLLIIDKNHYYFNNIHIILGILQNIINFYISLIK